MATTRVEFLHRQERTLPIADDELAGIYRLRRRVEPTLAAESCQLVAAGELDELERGISRSAYGVGNELVANRGFYVRLLRPAATHWDLLVLRPLWDRTDAVAVILRRHFPHHLARYTLTGHNLIAAYRTRDPEVTCRACQKHLDEGERIARRLLRAVS